MAAPALPPEQYLTLPEAVALVCPPLPRHGARRAIEEALCDGRLVETPRPLWSMEDVNELVSMAYPEEKESILARAQATVLTPAPAPPATWQSRFRDGSVRWETGEVTILVRTEHNNHVRIEIPVFDRAAVEALFDVDGASAATAGKPKRSGGAPERYDWTAAKMALTRECKQRGAIPGRLVDDLTRQTQADACKFVRATMAREWGDEGPSDSTLKDRVGKMLKEIEPVLAGN